MIKLKLGDCLKRIKELNDNSVDAIVTDPPYGLGFMGKKWDIGVPAVEVFEQCLRVLKPGGHLLAFGGSRTYHRLACAIEDVGFEIRDQIVYYYSSDMSQNVFLDSLSDEQQNAFLEAFGRPSMLDWTYGSGFPKSLNIGKVANKFLKTGNASWNGTGDSSNGASGYSKLQHQQGYRPEDYSNKHQNKTEITEEKAKQWDGFGTALKPAHEPIVLARKPLDGTVAGNVLKHGCGGLNIDGCRIETNSELDDPRLGGKGTWKTGNMAKHVYEGGYAGDVVTSSEKGRFPANLIHDGSEEVVGLFLEQQSGAMTRNYEYTNSGYSLGKPAGKTKQIHKSSSGSAARFFYCAKASKEDRDEGLTNIEAKQQDEGRKEGNPGGNNPRNRGVQLRKNHHPTVKPTKLIRYLCRLITPPGGIILDPFMGSGSTGKAAVQEGFSFIGIEKEKEYFKIAKERIKYEKDKKKKQLILF